MQQCNIYGNSKHKFWLHIERTKITYIRSVTRLLWYNKVQILLFVHVHMCLYVHVPVCMCMPACIHTHGMKNKYGSNAIV